MKKLFTTAAILLAYTGTCIAQIEIKASISHLPIVVDGNTGDWANTKSTRVPLVNNKADGISDIADIHVSSVIHGENIYFLFTWNDSSEDIQHKPFHWNSEKNKYTSGNEREDRLAIQFEMSGNYTPDWSSGNEFVADMWHWKAARSNPIGLVHDKSTIVSTTETPKSYEMTGKNGNTIYISRPSDAGDKIYSTKRYKKKDLDTMPKYVLNKAATGSVVDVKATGRWNDGTWQVELMRKLNTGNADDVSFKRGTRVPAGIAVFNKSGDDDHNISEKLIIVVGDS